MRSPHSEQGDFRFVITPSGLRLYLYVIVVLMGFADLGKSDFVVHSKEFRTESCYISSLCAEGHYLWSGYFMAMIKFHGAGVAAVIFVGIIAYWFVRNACRS